MPAIRALGKGRSDQCCGTSLDDWVQTYQKHSFQLRIRACLRSWHHVGLYRLHFRWPLIESSVSQIRRHFHLLREEDSIPVKGTSSEVFNSESDTTNTSIVNPKYRDGFHEPTYVKNINPHDIAQPEMRVNCTTWCMTQGRHLGVSVSNFCHISALVVMKV